MVLSVDKVFLSSIKQGVHLNLVLECILYFPLVSHQPYFSDKKKPVISFRLAGLL